MILYSATTNSFYDDRVNVSYPDDCVEIDSDYFIVLLDGRASGKVIVADADGYPTLQDAPPPTSEQVLATNSLILQSATQTASTQKSALTNRIGTINDAIELEMVTHEEEAELPVRVAQLKTWKTYAILLGRVAALAGWHIDPVWPEQPTEGMDLSVSAFAPESPQLQ